MGQRSQVIVRVPPVYYNEGNVNNQPSTIRVYHNQWMYGTGMVRWTARFLKGLQYNLKEKRTSPLMVNYFGSYGAVDDAVKYANHADLDHQTNTHPYEEEAESSNEELKAAGSAQAFLELFDNNNGYVYVEIDVGGSVSFGLLTGTEDDPRAPRQVSPEEMAKLHASPEQLAGYKEDQAALKELAKHPQVDALARITDLHATLNNPVKELVEECAPKRKKR